MFRSLLAQEALNKQRLLYCVRIMSVGCGTVAVKVQLCHSTETDKLITIQSALICSHWQQELLAIFVLSKMTAQP
jgi:hypothetical protein